MNCSLLSNFKTTLDKWNFKNIYQGVGHLLHLFFILLMVVDYNVSSNSYCKYSTPVLYKILLKVLCDEKSF